MNKLDSVHKRWVVFVVAVLVCHNWWPILSPFGDLLDGTRVNQYVDLVTPVAVIGTAVWVCSVGRMTLRRWGLFLLAAIAYAEGHGIHLAANDVNNQDLIGEAAKVAHFWDESFSHPLWYAGWLGLIALVVWSDVGGKRVSVARAILALVLGFTLFTNAVEGGVVPVMFAVAVVFVAVCARRRQGLQQDVLVAFSFCLLLLVIFGLWQGGYPEFSDLGWL